MLGPGADQGSGGKGNDFLDGGKGHDKLNGGPPKHDRPTNANDILKGCELLTLKD
jgi:Ca2+-binding RTX toxin-like protein